MVPFWLTVWFGLALVAGAVGLWFGGLLAFLIGYLLVSVTSVPVLALAGAITWFFWLTRFRVLIATAAGGATGLFTSFLLSRYLTLSATMAAVLSLPATPVVILGAIAGLLGGAFHCYWTMSESDEADAEHGTVWQFSIRDMFVRISIIALAMATLATVWARQRSAEDENIASICRYNLARIAIGLEQYGDVHGRLPPLWLVDDYGKPTMSWRVHVCEHSSFNREMVSRISLSEPWNGPNNTKIMQSDWVFMFCPGVSDKPTSITHYPAVTGPGTHWTEVGRIDEHAPQNAVLVIEWPRSDIHWAEPRDVTPDEFLAWFESKKSPPHRNHPGGVHYIDARGEVRRLPWNIKPDSLRKLLTPHPRRESPENTTGKSEIRISKPETESKP